MAEYHVGCGAFAIYAGTLNSRNKNMWQNKTECTDEAICAVRDYMVSELLGGIDCRKATSSGYEWTLKDGRTVGEEMSGMTLAKRFKTTLVEMGVKRLTVKSRIRIGEVWTKELSDEAELNMRKQLFGSQY